MTNLKTVWGPMQRRLTALFLKIGWWVLPPVCAYTRRSLEGRAFFQTVAIDLSPHVIAGLVAITQPLPAPAGRCRHCGRALPSALTQSEVCGQCLQARPPNRFVVCGFVYQGMLRTWIGALKYQGQLSWAGVLARLLYERLVLQGWQSQPLCLIPVPLHAQRLRQRGFNQSLELARQLCACNPHGTWQVCAHWVVRSRSTPSQVALSGSARRANLEGAFNLTSVASQQMAQMPSEMAWVVLDDVLTTGTTLNQVGRLLQKASPQRSIDYWVVARTPIR